MAKKAAKNTAPAGECCRPGFELPEGHSLFTSEAVTVGHPDKVCDQISDALLDAMIAQDPLSRVAIETMVSTGMCIVAGEVTTKAQVNVPDVVRQTIREIGYTDAAMGFDYEHCAVLVALQRQSPDIAHGRGRLERTRSRGPATRASCSATPAARRPNSCRCRSSWPTSCAPA